MAGGTGLGPRITLLSSSHCISSIAKHRKGLEVLLHLFLPYVKACAWAVGLAGSGVTVRLFLQRIFPGYFKGFFLLRLEYCVGVGWR